MRLQILTAILIFVSAPSISIADEWVKKKTDENGHTTARGNVEYHEETKAGVTFVLIKVNVWTEVSGGFDRTGRGHAIYTIWDKEGKPYRIIAARKYCSTGAKRSNEEHESTEIRFVKDSFFTNLDTDELEVFAEDKGGTPNNAKDLAKWIKDVAGPELGKSRDEVFKAAKDTVKEGGNWIIRKRK